MKIFNFQKAIYKYAIILSIAHIINMVWLYYYQNNVAELMLENENTLIDIISFIPRLLNILFNVVLAILVYKDFKANNIKSPLIVIITLLFGFIGVALFFIQFIYNQYIKKPAHNTRL